MGTGGSSFTVQEHYVNGELGTSGGIALPKAPEKLDSNYRTVQR